MTIYEKNAEAISAKPHYPFIKTALLSMMGGLLVGMGYIGYLMFSKAAGHDETAQILAKFFGAALFPIGILGCVFLGGSLFTSDSLLSISWYKKEVKTTKIVTHWIIVWVFNFVGSTLIAVLVWATGVFKYDAAAAHGGAGYQAVEHLTASKSNIAWGNQPELGWLKTIASGILCNILVAGSIFMANGVENKGMKVILIWFPITLFVAAGFQHTVANQFVFVEGWLNGTDTPANGSLMNLAMSGVGNWIGGAVFLPLVYGIISSKTKSHGSKTSTASNSIAKPLPKLTKEKAIDKKKK